MVEAVRNGVCSRSDKVRFTPPISDRFREMWSPAREGQSGITSTDNLDHAINGEWEWEGTGQRHFPGANLVCLVLYIIPLPHPSSDPNQHQHHKIYS
jgi:hypothetical protein